MYEANTWLWNFGQPQPPEPQASVASLSAAKTEKICKRSQCRVQLQRAPGRRGPGKPPRVLLRLMQTYDMYIPVIYLSYPLDQ